MGARLLLVIVFVTVVGCRTEPTNEFIRLEASPATTVQVDGVDVQAPGSVPLSTDRDHVVVWPDGSRSLIEGTNRGPSLFDFYIRSVFGVLRPRYLRWEQGQGVIVPVAR